MDNINGRTLILSLKKLKKKYILVILNINRAIATSTQRRSIVAENEFDRL
jgi:hypothetical protein